MTVSGADVEAGRHAYEAAYPFKYSIEQELTDQLQSQDHLTKEHLRLIIEWKSAGRGGRVGINQDRLAIVPPEVIEKLTNAAFVATDPQLQLKILNAIPGVGYATASVILAFHDPDTYAVGEPIVTEAVLGTRTSVTPSTFLDLLNALHEVRPNGYSLRDVERMFYMRNRE